MGQGLQRIAEAYGGMRVSARGGTCDYVAKSADYKAVIRRRKKQGWAFYGTTDDDKFLQFTMPTEEVERRKL
jgi:hypothetical protein